MNENRRVMIFGIDGATFDLIKPWMESGHLPTLSGLLKEGASCVLQSTLPPNSAPAWTSFMTGMNPGKHGVYGFTRVEPQNGYEIKVNSGATRRARTVWQYLSDLGCRSIALNIPMMYPPDPIDGIVVTGIDTPGLESQFTYPSDFRDEVIKEVPDYLLDVRSWGVTAVGEKRRLIFADIERMVESRRRLALHLLATQTWDIFTVVFTATDRVQHFFWRFLDPNHPLYDATEASEYFDAILRIYKQIDEAIREILETCDDDTTVIVMSDHGFGPQHRLFRINKWLLENQYLSLTYDKSDHIGRGLRSGVSKWFYRELESVMDLARKKLSDTTKDQLKRLFPQLRQQVASQFLFSGIEWSSTIAYHTAEFPGSLRINLKGREVNGIVEPGSEYKTVCERLKQDLERYIDPDTGKRVVERVFQRDELYWGPYLDLAPDLIVHLADYSYTFDWYMPIARKGGGNDLPVSDNLNGKYAVNCGYHRLNGILILNGPSIRKGLELNPAQITDVVPTTLYLMGLPIPKEMDGQILEEALNPELLESYPIEWVDTVSTGVLADSTGEAYTTDEAETVANRLRDLGYL